MTKVAASNFFFIFKILESILVGEKENMHMRLEELSRDAD